MLYTADVTESKDIEYNHYIQIANSSTKVPLLPNPYLAEGVKLFDVPPVAVPPTRKLPLK